MYNKWSLVVGETKNVFHNEASFKLYFVTCCFLWVFTIFLLTEKIAWRILETSEGRKKLWCYDPHEGLGEIMLSDMEFPFSIPGRGFPANAGMSRFR